MAKKVYVDIALNEARRRAIEKACIPRRIKNNYEFIVKDGKLILLRKKK